MEIFSSNLIEGSKKHLLFLTKLHQIGVTLSPPLTASLLRYVDIWLPLVHKCQMEDTRMPMIPPPDVAWLWHCHRLAPSQYELHVCDRFGRLIEATPSFAVQTESSDMGHDERWTRDKWNEAYPDHPFFLPQGKSGDSNQLLTSEECREKLHGFDLLASTKSQSTFLWQVSAPQYQDNAFLKDGVERYYKFLKLSQLTSESVVLVPTYQIDLVWHTHILSSIHQYNQDCIQICSRKFYHDDSLGDGDRTPGAELDRAFQETETLWRREYDNDAYKVAGTLYRGEPAQAFHEYQCWNPFDGNIDASKHGSVHLNNLSSSAKQVGATSTGRSEVPLQKWRSVIRKESLTSTGERCFIPAVTSNIKNPYRPGYSFGFGSQGWGYYSLETKEAWKIVLKRLETKESKARYELETFRCSTCCCSAFGGLSPNELAEQDVLQKKVSDIRSQKADVKRRIQAKGPSSPRSSTTDTSPIYFTQSAIMLTAACGGAAYSNGFGYGGSACGGGTHGGSGCGGGGCGGGGC